MILVSANLTKAETAYQLLRTDIVSCRLRPMENLQINSLTKRYSVSLSIVREALSRLNADGLVISEPQKGYHVAPVTKEDLLDLTVARIEIEKLCLIRSIEIGDVDWETGIVATMHRLSRTPYLSSNTENKESFLNEKWTTAHSEFHQALVSATGSEWLLKIRKSLYQQSERYRQLSVPLFEEKRDVDTEHQALADAALDRNSKKVSKLIEDHLNLTTKIIYDRLDKIDQSEMAVRRD